jgi:uncharacterized protein YcaQ
VSVRPLDRDEARQLAVRAQLLEASRPTDLVDLVDRLTLLQVDPTAAIAPNADLVAWSRLGMVYQPVDLTRALERDRTLFELRAYIRPMAAVALHVPEETGYSSSSRVRTWLEANDGFRRDIVARLRDSGPLLSLRGRRRRSGDGRWTRWGFALPVLHNDRLVGKLDAKADRKAGTLIINALHEDVRFSGTIRAAVEAEIEDLAAWSGLRITRA